MPTRRASLPPAVPPVADSPLRVLAPLSAPPTLLEPQALPPAPLPMPDDELAGPSEQTTAAGGSAQERRVWTPEEDAQIAALVAEHGTRSWSVIAAKLPTRTGKQCRERWHNHLDPSINKQEWSEEEDKKLLEAHVTMGNKWADIAKVLPGRTDNQIKNRWNSALRRELRKLNRLANKQRGRRARAWAAMRGGHVRRPRAAAALATA